MLLLTREQLRPNFIHVYQDGPHQLIVFSSIRPVTQRRPDSFRPDSYRGTGKRPLPNTAHLKRAILDKRMRKSTKFVI